jgi:nicotinate phosphoribosyltransferase
MSESVLLTDLYQLTMLQGYFDRGMRETAVFESFVRKLPERRNFLIAAGLEQALDYLEQVAFTEEELAWLATQGRLGADFLADLANFRFSGDVDAVPEGTLVFPDEPLLRVIAPLPEAQLVESRLINLLQFQTMVASKAVRARLAAPDRTLADFGFRRAHGAEAGLLSARASYLAGFDGTATVLAGRSWGIPLFGTMAHSTIQAHDSEIVAFEHFLRSHPHGATLLLDTYDTETAACALVSLQQRLRPEGIELAAVRLDSGDLAQHAHQVRAILNAGGLTQVRIIASGNLDEDAVQTLVGSGAPIDGFGIGTRMNTSSDQPYLDCAYKLQEYAGRARRKHSEGKTTWPGRKQIYRRTDDHGRLAGDTLTLAGLSEPGQPLLQPVMRGGRRLAPSPSLTAIRALVTRQLASLPSGLASLEPAPAYPVTIAPALRELAEAVDRLGHL